MPLITKPNYNLIFASQAPVGDEPKFDNYPTGWGVTRANNGKPTIVQFNYVQQTSDLKALWILQNGSCLPYDPDIEYVDGAPVLRNGKIQFKNGSTFTDAFVETPYLLKYFVAGNSYPINSRIMLANGLEVKSTIANNTNDPNIDMTGWEYSELSKSIYNPLNLNYTDQQLATQFTQSINSIIDRVSSAGGGTISIPDGQFFVDVNIGINLKNNIELRLGKGTIIKASPHNAPRYEILRVHDVQNVRICGSGLIDGSKSQNSATTGEWGMGVSIRGSDNIVVDGVRFLNTWGDGVYIGRTDSRAFSSNITLRDVHSTGTRRNGLSVISVKELDCINCTFDESYTIEPKCGVDIEPNLADEFIQGVRFKGLKTNGNNIGFNIFLYRLIGTGSLITIDIDGYTDRNSMRENFANRNYLPTSRGYIKVNDFVAINETQAAGSMISLYSFAKTGMPLTMNNVALSSGITNTDTPYVRIGRFDLSATNEVMGNIKINNISASSLNGTLPSNAIILNALPETSRVEGVRIDNIQRLEATSPIRSVSRISNFNISSDTDVFYRSLPSGQTTILANNIYPLYNKDTSVSSTVIIGSDLPSGYIFELRNSAAGSLDVNISLITLVSNRLNGSGALRCSTVGGFIKFKSLGGGVIEYLESYGYTQDGSTASASQAAISVPINTQVLLKNIALTGILTTDLVSASYSNPIAGLRIWAACEANGSVNVYAVNNTASALSLPAGTIKVNRL